jgi:hypothetical protein
MTYIPVGVIATKEQDRYKTSGPHLDVRIKPMYGDNKGVNIDPSLRPELLSRLKIGSGDDIRGLDAFPITSGFGPRNAPVPGASTYHKGIDYGIGAGSQINWEGPGDYFSEQGIGVINTKDKAGNPYEIELFHTLPGKAMGGRMAPPEGSPASQSMAVQAEAKERATNFSQMSKAQLDAAYDANRDSKTGLAMHKAYFGKK